MFTCLSCQVAFIDPEFQREHFQSDWHRYNLKRKVAELTPVTAESFKERVLAQQTKTPDSSTSIHCDSCRRDFVNQKSYENHAKSRRHTEKEQLLKENPDLFRGSRPHPHSQNGEPHPQIDFEEDSEVEEVDSDEWEGDPIPPTDCLFCFKRDESFEDNMKHMTKMHSLFVPDITYCVDLVGLVTYLGEKVGCGMLCLWCSKHFDSVNGVKQHMRDKGHCMIKFEGETLVEYTDFFDYSSSYPDADDPTVSPDQEVEANVLLADGYELTLPSGVKIGHRALFRYYKQRLNPNRSSLVSHRRSSEVLRLKLMSQYRALGWNGPTKNEIVKRARDVKFMKNIQAKQWMQVGVKGNKLQRHFRLQNPM